MIKEKIIFNCNACGAQFPKWMGQCTECNAWNSLTEETLFKTNKNLKFQNYAGAVSYVHEISRVELQEQTRLSTGISEFNRVLGGGVVAGSVILIGGDPGIGKSTLLLQVMASLSKFTKVLYVTGEESLQQVALRAKRLHLLDQTIQLLAEIQTEKIIKAAEDNKPAVLVIDSIQTICTEMISSAPGSVSQLRESTAQLVRFAKATNTVIFLVGHVTKEGAIAGPRVLEHMVDTVLYFEGETGSRFRVIRAVKNRFGAVNELGVFAMTEKGLREVNNPSAIFMTQSEAAVAGSIITAAWEGSRPLLVEVQSLVDTSHLGNPRRVSVGLETNRLAMLLAVLHRHAGIVTYDQDVFLNVVGGMRVLETSADLATLFAIVSSLKNKILPRNLLVFGEVGLGGEIRPVPNGQERIREAAKHGFKHAIIPKANAPTQIMADISIHAVSKLDEALSLSQFE
ncbi:MAG: DNA repair protein RadA [Gammaproteobacteria bacterium RIFCSPHIGHO2_12_FULL_35_23]|nr:MAG: DNA repair protein RadA [Gammaproteobacteria bacterium RIFCSPHIGHO2_12_FULL_35_23]